MVLKGFDLHDLKSFYPFKVPCKFVQKTKFIIMNKYSYCRSDQAK